VIVLPRHGPEGFPLALQFLRLLDGRARVGDAGQRGGAGDQLTLRLHVARVLGIESRLQRLEHRMEAGLQFLHDALVHGRVLAPLAARLDEHLLDRPPVGLLAVLLGREGRESLDQRLAPRLVRFAMRGLLREVLAAGFVGALGRLLELLPLGRGVLSRAAVQGAPLVAQPADVFRELLGRHLRADQRLNARKQLAALRHDREGLPVPELREPCIHLLESDREPRRQGRGLCQCLLDGRSQPRRPRRPAVIERRLRLSQQSEHASHLRVLCLALLLRSPTFGLERSRLLGGRLRRDLRVTLPLLTRFLGGERGGEGGGALLRGVGLGRKAMPLEGISRPRQLLRHCALQVRRSVRGCGLPASLEHCERPGVRRVDRSFSVLGNRSGRCLDLHLLLLETTLLGEQCIALGYEDAMNVLVVPVPGGADQFAQLVGIVDGLCRALTDLRRAALQDPLADRGLSRGRSCGRGR
jgi:hypothetical protein